MVEKKELKKTKTIIILATEPLIQVIDELRDDGLPHGESAFKCRVLL